MYFSNILHYPKSLKFKLTLALISSVFIYLFLIFFQPFGVNNYQVNEHINWELALGLISIIPVIFLTISFNEFILRPKMIHHQIKMYLILWIIYSFISVGTSSFFLYNYLGDFHDFKFSSYVNHVFEISTVLIFPFFGTLFFFRYSVITKDYLETRSISNSLSALNEVILIKGDYKTDQIALRQNAIICIESEDNYLGITFLENDHIKKHLIRATLSKMVALFDNELFVQCNRSLICNLFHLESIKKNTPGLNLKLRHIENPIKVSKTNTSKVLQLVEKHFNTIAP